MTVTYTVNTGILTLNSTYLSQLKSSVYKKAIVVIEKNCETELYNEEYLPSTPFITGSNLAISIAGLTNGIYTISISYFTNYDDIAPAYIDERCFFNGEDSLACSVYKMAVTAVKSDDAGAIDEAIQAMVLFEGLKQAGECAQCSCSDACLMLSALEDLLKDGDCGC